MTIKRTPYIVVIAELIEYERGEAKIRLMTSDGNETEISIDSDRAKPLNETEAARLASSLDIPWPI